MRVCFFDIDGTLVATGGAGQRAFADVFREMFNVDQIRTDIQFAGRSDRAIALDLMRAHGAEPSEENWKRFHDAYVERLPHTLVACQGTVLPGVVEFIARLSEAEGVEAGLLTGNVARGAEAKLRHYDLWHHFAFGGYGDLHADRCDIAKAAVDAGRKHLNITSNGRERLVVIGDTVHDITCARAIGAYAVAVPTGFTSIDELRAAEPDLLIRSLEEAEPLIDWLLD